MLTYIGIDSINNVTPSGFNDYIITDEIPVYDGVFEILLETENIVKLKGDSFRATEKVQQIFYPKYTLKIYESTEHDIEVLNLTRFAMVRREGFDTHKGKITNVGRELTGDSLYTVTIEYYDVSNQNVAEHLKSEFLKTTSLQTYDLYYTSTDFISTRIDPMQNFEDAEFEQTTKNDINDTNKSVLTEQYLYTFYCSEAEVIAMRRGLYKNKAEVNRVISLEIVNPEVEYLEGWDIYRVNINLITNKEIYKL